MELPGQRGGGAIAYSWREKKPSLNFTVKEQFLMPYIESFIQSIDINN
jgi:hypothetical protein